LSQSSILRDKVINIVKTKIQLHELQTNQIISETQLCSELNVSRTPVREALIQLVADGILKKIPHKGYSVQEFDVKSKLNLYAILAVLDSLAATLAINNIREEDIMKMNECIDKIDIAIKYRNYPDYYQLQNQFHKIYIDKCDNPNLIKMLDDIASGPLHISYISDNTEELFSVLKESNEEHREIVRLFTNKDALALENFLRYNHWATKHPDMI
jgi:DNA-binding GntR family transcriptional regulator